MWIKVLILHKCNCIRIGNYCMDTEFRFLSVHTTKFENDSRSNVSSSRSSLLRVMPDVMCYCANVICYSGGHLALWRWFLASEHKYWPHNIHWTWLTGIFLYMTQISEVLFDYHQNTIEISSTKFCTCHDSIAVVACAKFCADWTQEKSYIWWNFEMID